MCSLEISSEEITLKKKWNCYLYLVAMLRSLLGYEQREGATKVKLTRVVFELEEALLAMKKEDNCPWSVVIGCHTRSFAAPCIINGSLNVYFPQQLCPLNMLCTWLSAGSE